MMMGEPRRRESGLCAPPQLARGEQSRSVRPTTVMTALAYEIASANCVATQCTVIAVARLSAPIYRQINFILKP